MTLDESLTADERLHLARIRRLYDPERLDALDVVPLPTIIRHLWFVLGLLDVQEMRARELALSQGRPADSPATRSE